MELRREDFETVLIAEGGWGPVDRKVARANPGLVECKECSTKQHAVFHNLRGEHRHINGSQLKNIIDAEFGNF